MRLSPGPASLEIPPSLQCALQGHGIRIQHAAATGQAKADAGNFQRAPLWQMLREVVARGLAFDIIRKREDQFLHLARSHARPQRGEVQLIGPHPVNRRQFTVQDMIGAAKCTAPLDRDEIRHMLDYADDRRIPPLVRTDRAEFGFGEISTPVTTPNS